MDIVSLVKNNMKDEGLIKRSACKNYCIYKKGYNNYLVTIRDPIDKLKYRYLCKTTSKEEAVKIGKSAVMMIKKELRNRNIEGQNCYK